MLKYVNLEDLKKLRYNVGCDSVSLRKDDLINKIIEKIKLVITRAY